MRDAARLRRLRDAGWTVLVFTSDNLKHSIEMRSEVHAALSLAREAR